MRQSSGSNERCAHQEPGDNIAANKTSPTETPKPTGPYGELRLGLGMLGSERFDPASSQVSTANTILAAILDSLLRITAAG